MKYLGAQSGMGFLIIKAWRIQFSCMLFVCNNPIPSVSIRRWNTTISSHQPLLGSSIKKLVWWQQRGRHKTIGFNEKNQGPPHPL